MIVLFLPEISNQFVELAEILYDKGYMNFWMLPLSIQRVYFVKYRALCL